jgi:hypothetical protein
MASQRDLAFMGDDRVILDATGLVYAYAKPVTVNQALLSGAPAATRAVAPLFLQRLIYSSRVRQLGLWLGARRLPAATVNTYLQRLMPQPKYDLQALAPRLRTAPLATAEALFLLGGEPAGQPGPLIDDLIAAGWAGGGFEPLAQLSAALSQWDGEDWIIREQQIAQRGLAGTHIHTVIPTASWWEAIGPTLPPSATLNTPAPAALTPRQT